MEKPMDTKTQTIKHICQSDLASFIRLAFGMTHPDSEYRHHWPVEVIGDYLARCYEGDCRRLIINMPPRYLKSFCVSVAFPAWVLGRQPRTKIMCIAGNRGLAEDHLAMTRNLMSHRNYKALFPHLRWNETSQTIRLVHGGSRSAHAASPSSGITGRGADMIIIDDPLGAGYADDDKRREQINRWFDQNIFQRLNDKASGVVIVVMQRLHVDDLTGHILKQEGWEHLNLPAIAVKDNRYPSLYGDRIIRREGEALHPGIEDRDQLKNVLFDIGAQNFMAQYQQDPYSPGLGNGHNGPVTIVNKQKNKQTTAFFRIPEERFVLDEVFGEATGFSNEGLSLINSAEDLERMYGGPRKPQN